MTVSEIIKAMSPEAKRAVCATPGDRIGTEVPYGHRWDVLAELQRLGVTGDRGGLTIKGSAVAAILQEQEMEALFG